MKLVFLTSFFSNTKLQITILSTAGNFEIRQAIRDTWANPNNSKHVEVSQKLTKLIF